MWSPQRTRGASDNGKRTIKCAWATCTLDKSKYQSKGIQMSWENENIFISEDMERTFLVRQEVQSHGNILTHSLKRKLEKSKPKSTGGLVSYSRCHEVPCSHKEAPRSSSESSKSPLPSVSVECLSSTQIHILLMFRVRSTMIHTTKFRLLVPGGHVRPGGHVKGLVVFTLCPPVHHI